MAWSWNARYDMPVSEGGTIGTIGEAAQTKAWPRYEAEYLKRALQSDAYKYGTAGLDDTEKAVYLDRVVADFKGEADQCLKREFDDWLQGKHDANLADETYENAEGRPVRRWLHRTQEDLEGGYKVGQPREGWKHTPWGTAQLTGLPGVRDYLRRSYEDAHRKDIELQMLAEYGPQNLDQAWKYFKHWVKGRPLSDALCIDSKLPIGERSEYGDRMPDRMRHYDPDPPDRQPGVLARDANADEVSALAPTTDAENRQVQAMRRVRFGGEDAARDIRPNEDTARVAEELRATQRLEMEQAARQEVGCDLRTLF